MTTHKLIRRITLPIFLIALFLLPSCETVNKGVGKVVTTCRYDATLVAALGKTKADVQRAYKSSAKKDVATARSAVKEMVTTAESSRTATCSEPAAQAQKIQMLFDKMEFTKAKKAIDQNRLDNLMEAIDLAIATQNQLKK